MCFEVGAGRGGEEYEEQVKAVAPTAGRRERSAVEGGVNSKTETGERETSRVSVAFRALARDCRRLPPSPRPTPPSFPPPDSAIWHS